MNYSAILGLVHNGRQVQTANFSFLMLPDFGKCTSSSVRSFVKNSFQRLDWAMAMITDQSKT